MQSAKKKKRRSLRHIPDKLRWIHIIVVPCLLVTLFITVVLVQQRLHYKQFAAGNTITANPGDTLSQKVNSLNPGDTLILNDGTYTGSLSVTGKKGTSAAPILIKAAHDGKAIIDGGGSGNPIGVNNSSFITIEGLVAQNGQEPVVVQGSSDNIIIRRVTAHGASTGNWHDFDVKFGPTNVLIEDCAGWGNARYIFIAYHATNVTFRRTWAMWTSQSNFSPAPRSCYGVYGASNVILENAICFHAYPDQNSTDYFNAVWQTSDGPATNNISYYGVMFYNNWDGLHVNNLANSQNTTIVNSYFENNRQQGSFTTNRQHGDGIRWDISQGGTISNNTFVNNEVGIGGSMPTLTNNVFINNTTSLQGNTLGSSNKTVDPGYDVATYGRGAYLFVTQGSVNKAAGQGGGDIGANILYEYVNGHLTNQPLWPWPMEDRIKAEQGSSVTWATGGGFWKTLQGVYGTSVITPSILPTPTSMYATPTLYCLGACPTLTPTLQVTSGVTPGVTISPSPLVSQPGSTTSVSPQPSTQPTTTPIPTAQQGLIFDLIHLLLQLIQLLLSFFTTHLR